MQTSPLPALHSLSEQDSPLELSGDELRRLIEETSARLMEFLDALPERPMDGTADGAELARALVESLPERGTPFDELLGLLFDQAIPCTFNTAGGGYLAYIPGGGLPQSAIAALIANVVNSYITVWVASPALVQLESNVVSWFCAMMGLPETSGGYLSSGGSMANFSALSTARCELLPENFLKGTLYASDQVHHSLLKASKLAGFPERNVRSIPCDENFRMSLDALSRCIEEDRAAGLQPFFVVGNAGSTNTGAVDSLTALADLAEREKLWLHVDAAYGGFFQLTERGRQAMRGIGRADSITLDPHKGLFLPYGTGCLLVKDQAALKRTHGSQADYMPAHADPGFVDFCEISPELSRDIRGLRVWLPLKMYGIDVFRRQLDEKLDLAHLAADHLRAMPDVQIVAEPQLSLVVFRYAPPNLEDEQLNALNRRLLQLVNQRQRVMLTPTLVAGDRFVLRICVLSFRTHLQHMEMALEDIQESIAELQTANLDRTSHSALPLNDS